MRLAREFGFHTVDEMLAAIPSEQVTEWRALYEIEPWGEELFYRIMANIAVAICSAVSLGGSRYKASEFLPEHLKAPPPSELAQTIAAFRNAGIPVVIKPRGAA